MVKNHLPMQEDSGDMLFHAVHGVLKAEVFAIPFPSGQHFVRTLRHDPSVVGDPTWHGSWFH